MEPLGSGCCKPQKENDTIRQDIRSSTSPKALAASFHPPSLGAAMEEDSLGIERFCLLAGIAALREMMEEDATTVCGARHRHHGVGAVGATAGGRPRARSVFMAAG